LLQLSLQMMLRYAVPETSPPSIHVYRIPSGYRGTAKTAHQIVRLIRAGAKDFYVRQKAIDVLMDRRVRPKDYVGEIRALFEWVQSNIRYTKDPFSVEVLHSARRMLELRAGDCDDMTIVLGAMLESVGHPVRVVLTGPTPSRPRLFTHVYLEVFCQGAWIPLDATMRYPMGWAPRALIKRVIATERRPAMVSEDTFADTLEAAPEWLPGLLRAIRSEPIQPRDTRVKALWDLLFERRQLVRGRWLTSVLKRIWKQGLPARARPRTAARLTQRLQRLSILPAQTPSAAVRPLAVTALRPVQPVAVRAVGGARFVPVQPVRPASAQPIATATVARTAAT
jgi:hypothetical protein